MVVPSSATEAIAAFGDGAGITVLAGGTVVTPLVTHGALWPHRVLVLRAAGLDGIEDGATLVVGGAATLAAELFAVSQGADYIRTHDPAALADGVAIWTAATTGRSS